LGENHQPSHTFNAIAGGVASRKKINESDQKRRAEHSEAVDLPKRKDQRVFYAGPLAAGSFSICNLVPKEYPTPAAGRLLLASPQAFSNASDRR